MTNSSDQISRPDGDEIADLKNKTVVVTGSSTGIGREIALELARAGANVLVHAATSAALGEELAAEITDLGRQSQLLTCDFSSEDQLECFAEDAWSWRQGVDVWINNAGADVLTGARAKWSFAEKLDLLWAVDVKSTILLSRRIGDLMLGDDSQNKDRVIINMGWDQVEHGMGGPSGEMFSCIKGAIMAFSKSLAHSLAPTVRVNCVAPGWICTSWGEDASEFWQQKAQQESLLNRWGTPQDVARVVRFLSSASSQFVNGQVIAINGGFRHGVAEPSSSDVDST